MFRGATLPCLLLGFAIPASEAAKGTVDGRWNTNYADNSIVVINGDLLTWNDGTKTPLEIIDDRNIRMLHSSGMEARFPNYTAELKADDRLHWRDGNIWTRAAAPTSTTQAVKYYLVKSGAECKSSDQDMGKKGSVQECAAAVHGNGGSFFIFGTGSKVGKCYQENTASVSTMTCPEGWEDDSYDFYSFEANFVTAAPAPKKACNCMRFAAGESAGCWGSCCDRVNGVGGDGLDSDCREEQSENGCAGKRNLWGEAFCAWQDQLTTPQQKGPVNIFEGLVQSSNGGFLALPFLVQVFITLLHQR